MTTANITLDKKTNISLNGRIHESYTVKEAVEVLFYAKNLEPIISVTWNVVDSKSAPSIEKQNKTMLRRVNKIADGIGRDVEAFDQINGIIYGCVII